MFFTAILKLQLIKHNKYSCYTYSKHLLHSRKMETLKHLSVTSGEMGKILRDLTPSSFHEAWY